MNYQAFRLVQGRLIIAPQTKLGGEGILVSPFPSIRASGGPTWLSGEVFDS